MFEHLHERRDEYLQVPDFSSETLVNQAKIQQTTEEPQSVIPSGSQSLTTLNSSASTESLFSRKIQSLKNIFIGNNGSDTVDKAKGKFRFVFNFVLAEKVKCNFKNDKIYKLTKRNYVSLLVN